MDNSDEICPKCKSYCKGDCLSEDLICDFKSDCLNLNFDDEDSLVCTKIIEERIINAMSENYLSKM